MTLFAGLMLGALALANSGRAAIETPPPPSVWSDKADYAPGEQVTLSGANWAPGEAVHLRVNDDAGQTWSRDVDVTAAADGTISDQFNLPNSFVAVYSVTATGASSGTATWSFTDGNLTSVSGTVTDSVTTSPISGATLTCTTTSGCNATISTTTDASGNYSFSGGNKLGFATNGPVTLTLTVSKSGYTSGTITLSNVINGDSFTGKNIALTPSDTTAPTTTIQCNAAACSSSYYNANVSVTLAATDNTGGTGVKEIRFTTDGSTPTASDAATPNGTTYSGAFTVSTTATVKYRAFDNAGNAEAVKSQQVNIDKVAPTLTASAVKGDAPTFSGATAYTVDTWTNKDVRVTFTCADTGGSGLTAGSGNQTQDFTVDTSGTTATFSGTCADNAGNGSAGSTFGPVKIDKTAPVISGSALKGDSPSFSGATSYTADTWTNKDVRVSFSCADGLSGVASSTVAGQDLTANTPLAGTNVNSTGSCTDNAGNSATAGSFGPVKIDKTAPVIAGSAVKGDSPSFSGATAYTADTWTNKDVRVSFSCADALSGLATNTVAGQDLTSNTPAAGTTVSSTGSCTDNAGNSATAGTFGPVKIDKTAPVISQFDFSPAANGAGWNNSDITVRFKATDALSGLDSACLTAFPNVSGDRLQSKQITTEGNPVSTSSSSCTDVAGNTAPAHASQDFKLDKTAPSSITSSPDRAPDSHGWYRNPVTFTFTGTDGGSGIDSCSEVTYSGPDTGGQSVDGSCADVAGNTSLSFASDLFKYDATAPWVVLRPEGDSCDVPGNAGWCRGTQKAGFTSGDDGSGVETDGSGNPPTGADGLASRGYIVSSSTEGNNVFISSGAVTDRAGNTTPAINAGPYMIDHTAPTIANQGPTTIPNTAGWYNHDVVNQFKASDAVSGLDSACETAFPDPVTGGRRQDKTTSGEGTAVTVSSSSCDDVAGNHAGSIDSAGFKIDLSKPSSSASSPQYNNDGTIDVTYSASDTGGSGLKQIDLYAKAPGESSYSPVMSDVDGVGSGIDNAFAYTVPTSGGPTDYVQGTYRFYTIATDVADNAEATPATPDTTSTQTLQDSIAPSLAASHTADGNHGWNVSDPVTVTVSASDGGSGLDGAPSCSVDAVGATLTPAGSGAWTLSVTGEGTHAVHCSVSDKASNSQTADDTVKIDTTPPTISPTLTPAPNAAGWNNSDVTVSFDCDDALSGLNPAYGNDGAGCWNDELVTTEGLTTFVNRTATDNAGNFASISPSVKLDKTKPTSSASSPQYNTDGVIDVTYTASDARSGLKRVDLYAKAPGESSYSPVMSDVDGVGSGIDNAFAYTVPTSGGPTDYVQGTYRFYTIATDVADNAEATPATPDTTSTETLEDSIAPSLDASHTADGTGGWNTSSPVTVDVSASDSGSGLDGDPTCTLDGSPTSLSGSGPWTLSVSGEGTHAVHCSVSDKASNGSSDDDTVKIDTVDPSIALSHTANGAGWNNASPVDVSVAISDATSGLAGAPSCTVDGSPATVTGSSSPYHVAVPGEGTHPVSCSVDDNAGNSSSDSDTVKIDTVAPDTVIDTTPPNPSSSTSASFTFQGTDAGPSSGVAGFQCSLDGAAYSACNSGSQSYSGPLGDGSHTFSVKASDNAGNTDSTPASFTWLVDTVAPMTSDDAPSGWHNTAVTVHLSATDNAGGSGVDKTYYKVDIGSYAVGTTVTIGAPADHSNDGTHTISYYSKDNAGNVENVKTATVKIDTADPTITLLSRLPAVNANGWNNTDVTVKWTCSDTLSGVIASPVSDTKSAEAAGQTAHGTCQDNAGNTASASLGGISIDKTAPSLSPSISPAPPLMLGQSATASANATDGLSGIDSQSCGAVDTSSIGTHSVSCSATDKAGNANSASLSYAVNYNFSGFYAPVDNPPICNVAKAGSAIPVKFSLHGYQGMNIFAAGSPSSQPGTCAGLTSDPLEETVTAGQSSLNYDAQSDQYNYVWKTDKNWAGTARLFTVTLADGTKHLARFTFTK